MKAYEKKLQLEKLVRRARISLDTRESQLGAIKESMVILQKRNKLMEAALKKDIEAMETDYALCFDYHKYHVAELNKFRKIKPTTDVTPIVNGKKECDICGDEFSSQGFPAHRKKCERIHELEKELTKLEGEE